METIQTDNSTSTSPPSARALSPLVFYLIVLCVFLADQVSKTWVKSSLAVTGERPIIGDAFLLSLTYNKGGAWGILPQGNTLFIVFAGLAVLALLYAYHRNHKIELFVGSAFALALGGALGNLLDRVRFGSVVDFFYVKIINFPIFNVADSAITLGILLLLIHFMRSARDEQAGEAQPSPSASGSSGTL